MGERRPGIDGDGGPARRWSDAALVGAMRRNVHGAFREFFERFAPLIGALARIHRVPATDPEERMTEFLDDAVVRLCLPATPLPRSLVAYLAASFRKRSLNDVRDLRTRMRLGDDHALEVGGLAQRVMPTVVSESAIRATYAPGTDAPALAPSIERLALELERGLSLDDRRLLGWLGQRVPQREIAVWLGMTHGALRVRVTRLRSRLREAAFRHANQLDDGERAEIDRFFRRVDIVVPTSLAPREPRPGKRGNSNPAVEDQHR